MSILPFYIASALLMVGMPIGLAVWLTRRFKLGWGLWGVGAASFVGSQIVRLPLLSLLTVAFAQGLLPSPPREWSAAFNIVVLSLTAGLFEEGARYVAYRYWAKAARTWREALALGAGHGGIEAILTGLAVGLTIINMVALQTMDVTTLPLSAEQQSNLAQQVTAFWSAPWYLAMAGALERLWSLIVHLSLSVMVLQAFTRRNRLWLLAAIGWHALSNMLAAGLLPIVGVMGVEAILGMVALISLGFIFALRPQNELQAKDAPASAPLAASAPTHPVPPANPLEQQMDDSRYTN